MEDLIKANASHPICWLLLTSIFLFWHNIARYADDRWTFNEENTSRGYLLVPVRGFPRQWCCHLSPLDHSLRAAYVMSAHYESKKVHNEVIIEMINFVKYTPKTIYNQAADNYL